MGEQLLTLSREPSLPDRGRLATVSALRGAAALSVALYHGYGVFSRWQQGTVWDGGLSHFLLQSPASVIVGYVVFGFGFVGVPLFFVISGFCIHLPLAATTRTLNPREFSIRRW